MKLPKIPKGLKRRAARALRKKAFLAKKAARLREIERLKKIAGA